MNWRKISFSKLLWRLYFSFIFVSEIFLVFLDFTYERFNSIIAQHSRNPVTGAEGIVSASYVEEIAEENFDDVPDNDSFTSNSVTFRSLDDDFCNNNGKCCMDNLYQVEKCECNNGRDYERNILTNIQDHLNQTAAIQKATETIPGKASGFKDIQSLSEREKLRSQLTDEILEIKQDNERLYDEIKCAVEAKATKKTRIGIVSCILKESEMKNYKETKHSFGMLPASALQDFIDKGRHLREFVLESNSDNESMLKKINPIKEFNQDHTISDIKKFCDPHTGGRSYELRSGFPPKPLDLNSTSSLVEAKLLNETLFQRLL
ncbi:Oidioi.mRNA.OKI2018_I69.YSR.g17100.t1.cds [Oikopleura dioica]|uniref:Oidioi.mRNA.OKI2018_I69.YSR.g17100.t1.cds n=1 Tax=Oikopleura dioica TaxID=34765 RepID=A0ABN7SME7_OIKDI|nr:Oidioi.mRNA.OKI2018_I69.YSR.g17100.t1.cds [Oikopleura dioica]